MVSCAGRALPARAVGTLRQRCLVLSPIGPVRLTGLPVYLPCQKTPAQVAFLGRGY